MRVMKMLQHDKIDVSEGIDINKTSESRECMLCHYWYFKDWRIVYITSKFNFCKKKPKKTKQNKTNLIDSILNSSLHN